MNQISGVVKGDVMQARPWAFVWAVHAGVLTLVCYVGYVRSKERRFAMALACANVF